METLKKYLKSKYVVLSDKINSSEMGKKCQGIVSCNSPVYDRLAGMLQYLQLLSGGGNLVYVVFEILAQLYQKPRLNCFLIILYQSNIV